MYKGLNTVFRRGMAGVITLSAGFQVEKAPIVIKAGLKKDEAEALQQKLEAGETLKPMTQSCLVKRLHIMPSNTECEWRVCSPTHLLSGVGKVKLALKSASGTCPKLCKCSI